MDAIVDVHDNMFMDSDSKAQLGVPQGRINWFNVHGDRSVEALGTGPGTSTVGLPWQVRTSPCQPSSVATDAYYVHTRASPVGLVFNVLVWVGVGN